MFYVRYKTRTLQVALCGNPIFGKASGLHEVGRFKKLSKVSLVQQIYENTGIPRSALLGDPVTSFSIEERLLWARGRRTTEAEDKTYCLFGIFNVSLPVLYGEGEEKALERLKKEIGGKFPNKVTLALIPSILTFRNAKLTTSSLSLHLVSIAQIDQQIRGTYDDERLKVERLSGKSLPLEHCFVNLGIIDHIYDSARLTTPKEFNDEPDHNTSKFSLAARLKVEIPLKSDQVTLQTLFNPRTQKDGTQLWPKRVLIFGRAGMGKTALCKKVVHEVYNHGLWRDLYDRVMWIPLRKLKRAACQNIIEFLLDEFSLTGLGERVSQTLNKLICNGRTLFLLDGLNEVSFALDNDSPVGNVLRRLLAAPDVIITSRCC